MDGPLLSKSVSYCAHKVPSSLGWEPSILEQTVPFSHWSMTLAFGLNPQSHRFLKAMLFFLRIAPIPLQYHLWMQ